MRQGRNQFTSFKSVEPSASTISSAEANKSFRIALSDGVKSAYLISGIILGNTD